VAERILFSIVMATRDRSSSLRRTLDALQTQDRDDWELLVVNNGSTDGTANLLHHYSSILPLRFFHLLEPGKNRALNLALPHAKGDLLVFIDDDITMAQDWLSRYAKAADRFPEFAIFGGPIAPVGDGGDDLPSWLQDHSLSGYLFGALDFGSECKPFSKGQLPFGANFVARRALVSDKLFSEHMGPAQGEYRIGGETDFLKQFDEPALYVPEARIRHFIKKSDWQWDKMMARARKAGRGQFWLYGPDTSARPKIFGVPAYLYRMLLVTVGRCIRFSMAGKSKKLSAHFDFHRVLGLMVESASASRGGR
jgi:glycosyltransferase involved in cell wall biosynthesis